MNKDIGAVKDCIPRLVPVMRTVVVEDMLCSGESINRRCYEYGGYSSCDRNKGRGN